MTWRGLQRPTALCEAKTWQEHTQMTELTPLASLCFTQHLAWRNRSPITACLQCDDA